MKWWRVGFDPRSLSGDKNKMICYECAEARKNEPDILITAAPASGLNVRMRCPDCSNELADFHGFWYHVAKGSNVELTGSALLRSPS